MCRLSRRPVDITIAVVQSDVQFNAVNGIAQFADAGPFEELRFVFSVHSEPFTVVVRADSGIETFEDLVGKRVNVGNPGSGQRATMELVMDLFRELLAIKYQLQEMHEEQQKE